MKQRCIAILLALSLALSLALTGCSQESSMIMVGIAMASEETSSVAGEAMQSALEESGYTVELAYAESADDQSSQISAMVEDGASILIVDPVDPEAASETLTSVTVDVSDVAVIAYRDPLEDGAANSYVGRDYYAMGQQEAEHLVDRLLLETRDDSITLEIVAGKGSSAEEAFEGAMDVLQPYIDAGTVEIPSGNTSVEDCQTDDAAAWAEEMFSGLYSDQELRAIMCLGEGQAVEVVDTILTSYTGTIYPVVTGSDCSAETLAYMSSNLLDMVSYSDDDPVIEQTLATVETIVAGATVDEEYLLDNTAVTTDTYLELMVESGLYTANDDGTFTEN
ncbi:MAG: substrate-binding domain-containing protein [Clostridiales bacterium]|nr:substrate-binding domain-containing protein [Clostridiales bacterium]